MVCILMKAIAECPSVTLKPRMGVRVHVTAAGEIVINKKKKGVKIFCQDSFSSAENEELLGIKVVVR